MIALIILIILIIYHYHVLLIILVNIQQRPGQPEEFEATVYDLTTGYYFLFSLSKHQLPQSAK